MNKLKAIRHGLCLTQAEFATLTRIPVDTIKAVEAGRRRLSALTRFRATGGTCPICGQEHKQLVRFHHE